ncbi:DUF537-domain-containing protein [Obba rivulosa]|uniref:DUF537-domain-containing protein n=1 Tax=Obba rivulosa TaxID=1052685 RepID=A0A8E2DTC0_9APHY|nr:DUF537-domain-containing protein [Obba rivulosa]
MSHNQESVAVFWDFENCTPPCSSDGYSIVSNIREIAHEYGSLKQFKAYLQLSEQSSKSVNLRSDLQSSGVSLIDCPHNGRKDVADKMMMVDMLTFAMDTPAPATIIIISGDRDFVYAVSVLRMRRYRVVLIAPRASHTSLKCLASTVLEWERHVLPTSSVDSAGSAVPEVPGESRRRARSSTTSTCSAPLAEPRTPRRPSFRSAHASARNACGEARPTSHEAGGISSVGLSVQDDAVEEGRPLVASRSRSRSSARVQTVHDLGNDVSALSFEDNEHIPDIHEMMQIMRERPLSSDASRNQNSRLSSPYINVEKGDSLDLSSEWPSQLPSLTTSANTPPSEPLSCTSITSEQTAVINAPYEIAPIASLPQDSRQTPIQAGSGPAPTDKLSQEHAGETTLVLTGEAPQFTAPSPPADAKPEQLLPPIPYQSSTPFDILATLLAQGMTQPLRTTVAVTLIDRCPHVYIQAGVQRFKEYSLLAQKAGIIELGGIAGSAWIALAPVWRGRVAKGS